MHIELIEVFVFKYDHHYQIGGHGNAPNRLPGTDYYFEPQWKHVYSRQTESCLVKITTNVGLVGWGEAQAPIVPEVPATLIGRLYGPAILGMNPEEPAAIYDRLYHLNHVRGHTASYTIDAIAAIDIAVWDIKGQARQQSIGQMLGAEKSKRLPLYISGLRRSSLEERKALAKEKIAEGFKGVKIFMGASAEKTIEECAAIREAIGSDADLSFDAICRHNLETAYTIGKGLDALRAAWFESPLDPEDVAGHRQLGSLVQTPLAIGEALRTVREFEPWLREKAMKIAQPDIVRCGISGGWEIIKQASNHELKCGLHLGVCTGIGVAATWQVSSAITKSINQEHQLDMFPAANKVLSTPLQVINGHAIIPQASGLGVEVDEGFVRAHSAEQWFISFASIKHIEASI